MSEDKFRPEKESSTDIVSSAAEIKPVHHKDPQSKEESVQPISESQPLPNESLEQIPLQKSKTEHMEVHAHSHTPRKKWTHYFWEFLMLFLAITMGFFVENQREHYIEMQRARQFAISLIEDLKTDTAELNTAIRGTQKYVSGADTLLAELDKPASLQNDTLLQRLTAQLPVFNFYDPQLSTYNQIKNSGSLRYFNIEIIKRLNKYETYANYILKMNNQSLDIRTTALIPFVYKIQNTRFIRSLRKEIDYNGPVFIEKPDNKLIQEWYNFAYGVKRDYALIVKRMEIQRIRAIEILGLLEKEYGLK